MSNKATQDMTGTGMYLTLAEVEENDPIQLELFPELNPDPEPERYYDWMLWKLRQDRKKP